MNGLMQAGPTLYEAEQRRKKAGSQGLLGAVGEPLSYAPGPVGLLGNALLGARYLTGEADLNEGMSALGLMSAMAQGTKVAPIMRDAIRVYHGTRATKDWMDDKELMKKFQSGEDIPAGIASSTFPIEKPRGFLGGLKVMDGLGPHVGTANAANERLAKNQKLPSKVFDQTLLAGSTAAKARERSLNEAYIMPFDIDPKKQFAKKDGTPFTESELQSKLADIAEKLGFSRADARAYSSAYPGKIKAVQAAVRDKLRADGFDAIPYINSHEDRGSVSWVILNDDLLKSPWTGLLGK